MPADLMNLNSFFDNRDAYTDFLRRVTAAVVEKALALRAEAAPDPVTGTWAARQQWALSALCGPEGARTTAARMLPGLAATANDAGLLSANGTIDATDTQIRSVIDDDFIDLYAGLVADVP